MPKVKVDWNEKSLEFTIGKGSMKIDLDQRLIDDYDLAQQAYWDAANQIKAKINEMCEKAGKEKLFP